jgi:PAS domain S-box-containing protein
LKETLDNLENLVQERTSELEKAYNSLKEGERGLAEAQKMAHIGNWYRNLKTDKIYWSDEVYRIFGFKPQEFEVTYNSFLSYVHLEDRGSVNNNFKKALNGEPYSSDYRITSANGIERIVHAQGEVVFDEEKTPIGMRGTIQDITERKRAEEALEKIEKIRIKEIHHRIKNNLQVISSLLSLEAERFTDEKMLEALRESQNRVTSMALIHEELYKGGKNDSVDFAAYLQKLTADLFSSYNLGNDNINLKMDLDQVYLEMDTAIPLGIIVNELVSNSLKHAFPAGGKGEININLCKNENFAVKCNVSVPGPDCMEKNGFYYVLTVTDNGKGIPEEIEFQNADSLGLQLINILVEQIDGCIELKRNNGAKFTIWFSNIE